MLKITDYCKKFNKKPASFMDNPRIKQLIKPDEKHIVMGANGYTMIHEKYTKEFLLWLSPETRQMVLDGVSSDEILDYVSRLAIKLTLDTTKKLL